MEELKLKLKFKREVRRRRHHSAWITATDGLAQYECRLTNLSQAGAEIIIDAATELPSYFALAFVPTGATRRSCEVIWRRGKTVGIRFVQQD